MPSRNRDAVVVERVFAPMDTVFKIIKSGSTPEEVVDAMISGDARRYLFQAANFFRIYSKDDDFEPILSPWLARMKRLEDALGDVTDFQAYHQTSVELGVLSGIEHHLKGTVVGLRQALIRLLKTDGWLEFEGKKSLYVQLNEDLEKLDWKKQKKDRKFILRVLIAQAEKIRDADYDMSELESGLHELRRKLRSILISIHLLRGKVEIVRDTPSQKLNQLLSRVKLESRFLKFPHSDRVKRSVQVRESHYLAMSYWVGALSAVKDYGKQQEVISSAYLAVYPKKSPSDAIFYATAVLSNKGIPASYLPEADQLYRELKESKLLEDFIEHLKDQLAD